MKLTDTIKTKKGRFVVVDTCYTLDHASKITIAANRLLGKEQMKALKEHVRNEKGRVSAAKMIEEITQIFKNQSGPKNS